MMMGKKKEWGNKVKRKGNRFQGKQEVKKRKKIFFGTRWHHNIYI